MASVNQQVMTAFLHKADYFDSVSNAEAIRISKFLDTEVLPGVESKLAKYLGKSTITETRLKSLRDEVTSIVRGGFNKVQAENLSSASAVIKGTVSSSVASLKKSTPKALGISFVSPSLRMIKPEKLMVQGALIPDWYKKMSDSAAFNTYKEIRIGVTGGESVPSIVNRVRGVTGKSKREVTTFVRTSLNDVGNQANEETYRANSDVIKGVRIVATLDNVTSEICQNEDGKVYDIGDGPRPPFHFNCRTRTVPVLKSWKELGIKLKDVPETTRASMDGQVPANMTYKDWKATQGTQGVLTGKATKAATVADVEEATKARTFPSRVDDVSSIEKFEENLTEYKGIIKEEFKSELETLSRGDEGSNSYAKSIENFQKKVLAFSKPETDFSTRIDIIRPTGQHASAISKAIDSLNEVVSDKIKERMKFADVTVFCTEKAGRAHYSDVAKSIYLYGGDGKVAYMHEFGHHVEDTIPVMRAKAQKWRLRRATESGNPAPVPCNKVHASWRDKGVAYKDKFVTPYVGRVYDSGHTEVISVGLQQFGDSHKLASMARYDFDYFCFILGLLKGHI